MYCELGHQLKIYFLAMHEYRKGGQTDGFKRGSEIKGSCRSREPKQRFQLRKQQTHTKEGQTTDCTKSSNEIRTLYTNKTLEQTITELKRQNEDLKQTIIMLKTEQFMRINEDKLKNIIREHENYKLQLKHSKQEIEQLRLENSFLARTNQTLKEQIDALSKQVKSVFQGHQLSTSKGQSKEKATESISSEVDDLCKSIYRNASTEVLESRGTQKNRAQQRIKTKKIAMESDYYLLRKENKSRHRQRR